MVFCSLFYGLLLLISLLGHAPSFFGQISHDTIIVAPFVSFLNVLFGVFFIKKNTKNKTKTQQCLSHISTTAPIFCDFFFNVCIRNT